MFTLLCACSTKRDDDGETIVPARFLKASRAGAEDLEQAEQLAARLGVELDDLSGIASIRSCSADPRRRDAPYHRPAASPRQRWR
jgi:hypothetical protein